MDRRWINARLATMTGDGLGIIEDGAVVVRGDATTIQMGGPRDFSNMKRTRVMRKGGPAKGIPVNVPAIEKGEFDKDVVLEPGDTIIVPEASLKFNF